MTALLPRTTALPFAVERTFYTILPGETRIVIPVLEGESADPTCAAASVWSSSAGCRQAARPADRMVAAMPVD